MGVLFYFAFYQTGVQSWLADNLESYPSTITLSSRDCRLSSMLDNMLWSSFTNALAHPVYPLLQDDPEAFSSQDQVITCKQHFAPLQHFNEDRTLAEVSMLPSHVRMSRNVSLATFHHKIFLPLIFFNVSFQLEQVNFWGSCYEFYPSWYLQHLISLHSSLLRYRTLQQKTSSGSPPPANAMLK